MRSLIVVVLLTGCGRLELERPQAVPAPEAPPAEVAPAQVAPARLAPDPAPVPSPVWADVQPVLLEKCPRCHEAMNGGLPSFADDYAVMLQSSTLCRCQTVGECVKAALLAQEPEGDRCRTYVVAPFHREGWRCLTSEEISTVVRWIDTGMREK
jgi:hypothetical protein